MGNHTLIRFVEICGKYFAIFQSEGHKCSLIYFICFIDRCIIYFDEPLRKVYLL